MTQYIIFDLEATCWADKEKQRHSSEIIEIGAVRVLGSPPERADTFNLLVRPVLNPVLSEYCTRLTGIEQKDVDGGKVFHEAMQEFEKWIGKEKTVMCSWGFYDKKQILREAKMKGYEGSILRLLDRHISLKHQLASSRGVRPREINSVVYREVPMQGRRHRALDDALYYTTLFLRYSDVWSFPSL